VTPYRATAVREGDWWVLTVENLGTTQAATLEAAEAAIIDMISSVIDVDPDEIEVEIFQER
jgi:hypothetical protein